MCDPQHSGPACKTGVSAVSRNPLDARNGNLVCGQSTEPQRGFYDGTKCKCNANPVLEYVGEACECFTKDGEMCAGVGVCRGRKFPYGTCLNDFLAFQNDPLSKPYVVAARKASLSKYVLASGSVISMDGSNTTYLLKRDEPITFDLHTVGENFSTCASRTKVRRDFTFDDASGGVPVSVVSFNVKRWRLSNDCSVCACNGNGDLTVQQHNASCVHTVKFVDSNVPALGAYRWCRTAWLNSGSIDPSFFDNAADDRTFDEVRTCIAGYNVTITAQDAIAPAHLADATFVCVNGTRSYAAYHRSPYGMLECNNAVHRVVDQSISLLYPTNYTRQCAQYPIQDYSFEVGDFFGLFNDAVPGVSFKSPPEKWTTAHFDLLSQVVAGVRHFRYDDALQRDVPIDLLTEEILDLWKISWVANVTVNGTTFVPYSSLNKLGQNVTSGSLGTLLDILFDIIEPVGVTYAFLDEEANGKYPTHMTNGVGSPLRSGSFDFMAYISAGNNTAASRSLTRALFDLGRNYTALYFDPGLAQVVANTERTPAETGLLGTNLSSSINTLRITFPVDLDSFTILMRTGEHCVTIVAPRAGDTVDVLCDGGDPFVFNEDYNSWIANAIAQAESDVNLDPSNGTWLGEVVATAFAKITSEGVQIQTVPESFYSVSPSVAVLWNKTITYGTHTFGPDQSIDRALLYFQEWINNYNITLTEAFSGNWMTLGISTVEYAAYWQALSHAILVNRRFPFNGVFAERAAAAVADSNGKLTSRAINTSDPDDRVWLTKIHNAHLAARRCSTREQCTNNQLGSECVFDVAETVPWLNGDPDPSLTNHAVGNEGGCDCSFGVSGQFFDPSCLRCLSGYGPSTNCTTPQSYEAPCGPGGKGTVDTIVNAAANLAVFRDPFGEDLVFACTVLFYRNEKYTVTNATVDVNVQTWRNDAHPSTVINYVYGDLYLNGTDVAFGGDVECLHDMRPRSGTNPFAIVLDGGATRLAERPERFVMSLVREEH